MTALAPGGGVDDLLQSLVDHVAVTLDGEHDGVGLARLTPVASDGARPCSAWTTSTSSDEENPV